MRKFDYLVILQGHYGHGWEDLTAATDDSKGREEVKNDLRAYRENEGGLYRVIRRRVEVQR
jgi:hypothetical protein